MEGEREKKIEGTEMEEINKSMNHVTMMGQKSKQFNFSSKLLRELHPTSTIFFSTIGILRNCPWMSNHYCGDGGDYYDFIRDHFQRAFICTQN